MQYYEVVADFEGEVGFRKTKRRDEIKKEFLIENDIQYLIIKYTDNISEVLKKRLLTN